MAEYQKIGGVWKPVTPFVKVGGTWRSCVKHVRVGGVWKSMGAAPWALSDLGTERQLDLDASVAGSITGTSTVTAWADQSGNGQTAVGYSGRQPSYDSTVKSIKNGIMGLVYSSVSTEFEAFIVTRKLGDSTDYRTLLQTGSNDHHILTNVSTNDLSAFNAGIGTTTHTWPATELHIVRCQRIGAGTSLSLDGGSLVSTGKSNNVPAYLGGAVTGGQNFGDVHQIVIVPATISNANVQRIEGLLARKWDALLGVTTLVTALPSGHPYKSVAP